MNITGKNSIVNKTLEDLGCHSPISSHHSACYLVHINIIITILICILIVDLIGNVIVIIVITTKRRMQTFTNLLILNLAFADLSVALFCIPLEIPLEIKNEWIYGRFFCTIFYPLQSSTIYGSVFTLVALSCSRYWALLHPFKRQPTKSIGKITIVLIWTCSLICVAPYMNALQYDPKGQHCSETWGPSEARTFTIVTFTVQYMLPLSIISAAYLMIVYDIAVKKRSTSSHADKRKAKENKKLIKLLLIITVTFALCVLPYHVIALWYEFGNAGQFPYIQDLSVGAFILLYSNSAINPVIYNIFSSNFRRGFARSYKSVSKYFYNNSNHGNNKKMEREYLFMCHALLSKRRRNSNSLPVLEQTIICSIAY